MYQYHNPLSRLATGSKLLDSTNKLKYQKTSELSHPFSITASPIKKQQQSLQPPIIETYCGVEAESIEDQVCFECLNTFISGMAQGAETTRQFVFEQLTAFRNLIDYLLNLMKENANEALKSSKHSLPEIVRLEQKRFPNGVNRLLEQSNKSLQSYEIVHPSEFRQSLSQQDNVSMHSSNRKSESLYKQSDSQLEQGYFSEYERQAANLEADMQDIVQQEG